MASKKFEEHYQLDPSAKPGLNSETQIRPEGTTIFGFEGNIAMSIISPREGEILGKKLNDHFFTNVFRKELKKYFEKKFKNIDWENVTYDFKIRHYRLVEKGSKPDWQKMEIK